MKSKTSTKKVVHEKASYRTVTIEVVKAWAILRNKKVIAVEVSESKPKRFNVGSWVFFVDDWNSNNIVPCTITYSLPLTKTSKKVKTK